MANGITGQEKKDLLASRLDRALSTKEEALAVSNGEVSAVLNANRATAKQQALLLDALGLAVDGFVRGQKDTILQERMRAGEVEEHAAPLAMEEASAPPNAHVEYEIPEEEWRKMTGDDELAPATTQTQYANELFRWGVSDVRNICSAMLPIPGS